MSRPYQPDRRYQKWEITNGEKQSHAKDRVQ